MFMACQSNDERFTGGLKDVLAYTAKNPNKLNKIKEKLHRNRISKPLFNTKLYTKNLENGYKRAYQLYINKKKIETIYV